MCAGCLMGSAFLRPTFLWLSHGTQRMLQPQFPPAPPEELSRASQGDEEASLVQWVAGMLIRARGCSRRLLSPLTSPTFKLQSGEGAEKMKLETSPASAGIGRGRFSQCCSPFPTASPCLHPHLASALCRTEGYSLSEGGSSFFSFQEN